MIKCTSLWIICGIIITYFPLSFQYEVNSIIKLDSAKQDSSNIIEDTMRLLEDGRKELNFSGKAENSFFLGTTGTGKTTLSLIITGDNSKLISVDVGGNNPTGEYIIVDETGLISNSTVVSKTILPYLFIDYNEKDSTYYDCPGYDDTRNSSVDMTSAFFIKDIVDYTEFTKFVFVIHHNSVSVTGSRSDFLTLTEHIDRFMKDVNKYEAGIGTVINKVDKPSTSDEMVVSGVRVFLEKTLDVLQTEPNPKPFYPTAIKFINIMLKEENERFPKIMLLRQVDRPGPLSEIEEIQKCRRLISNMIYNDLKFVKKSDDDFGYTISDSSQVDINAIAGALNEEIALVVKSVNDEIQQHFIRIEENMSLDMNVLAHTFDKSAKTMEDMCNNPELIKTTNEFILKLNNTLDKLEVQISDAVMMDLLNKLSFFEFIQIVSFVELKIDVLSWLNNLLGSKTDLIETNQFYTFLPNLNTQLSKYDYQSDVTLYNVANINDWGQPGKPQGINVKQDNWELFLNRVGFTVLKDVPLTTVKEIRLNTILEWTLKYKIKNECTGNTLTISGEYVKMTDVIDAKCDSAEYITMMAINNIFFNTHLDQMGKGVELSIMAQAWDVIGKREISLNGAIGTETLEKANDAPTYNRSGENGIAGGNGGMGGQFFGVAETFQNGQDLSINVNGGRGGHGQPGGNGYNVNNQLPVPRVPVSNTDCFSRIPARASDGQRIYDFKGMSTSSSSIPWGFYYEYTDYDFDVYGDCGGNGGNGGAGGNGGKSGTVEIISLNKPSDVIQFQSMGENGDCGDVGKAGQSNEILKTTCTVTETSICSFYGCQPYTESNSFKLIEYAKEPFSGCPNLQNGKPCVRKMIDVDDVNNNYSERINKQTEINKYKSFITSNNNVGLRKQTLDNFLILLNKA